jgi:hypothetical protein
MISHGIDGLYGLDEPSFISGALALLTLVLPAAVWFTLWRMFVTNRSGPRGGIVVLGLDDSSSTYSDLSPKSIPIKLRLSYCVVSLLTFAMGILTFEGVQFLW